MALTTEQGLRESDAYQILNTCLGLLDAALELLEGHDLESRLKAIGVQLERLQNQLA